MTDTDTEFGPYEDMTPEEQQAFREECERKHLWYLYQQYSSIVDAIIEHWDVAWEVAIRAAADHANGIEEAAAEEAREDLLDRCDEVADEIASEQRWEEKQDEADE